MAGLFQRKQATLNEAALRCKIATLDQAIDKLNAENLFLEKIKFAIQQQKNLSRKTSQKINKIKNAALREFFAGFATNLDRLDISPEEKRDHMKAVQGKICHHLNHVIRHIYPCFAKAESVGKLLRFIERRTNQLENSVDTLMTEKTDLNMQLQMMEHERGQQLQQTLALASKIPPPSPSQSASPRSQNSFLSQLYNLFLPAAQQVGQDCLRALPYSRGP